MPLVFAGLAACAAIDGNAPLAESGGARPTLGAGYSLNNLERGAIRPDTLILLAFTGGGKRSAAFSYGALIGMSETRVTGPTTSTRLLDQVSAISAASGGSFTAAYYGLHRDRIFKDFERDFLKRDLEAYIYGTYLLAWNWRWMVDANYGTSDRMAEVYDRLMFHGARYEDLHKRGRPLIMLQATDVSYGTVFSFTQDTFDVLCSDLHKFSLSRAVAASNGFPIVFTPITLVNHANRCRGQEPEWLAASERDSDPLARRRFIAAQTRRYLDQNQTRYVHLLDGGIADNLAMRGYVAFVDRMSENARAAQSAEFRDLLRTRRILLLSVDGQAAPDSSWAQRRSIGGLTQVFSAVSGTLIDRYNFDTLRITREALVKLKGELVNLRCRSGRRIGGHACEDVQVFFEHLSLNQIKDDGTRQQLGQIPTGLTLKDRDVDLLVEAGRHALRDSRVIRDFVESYRVGARVSYER